MQAITTTQERIQLYQQLQQDRVVAGDWRGTMPQWVVDILPAFAKYVPVASQAQNTADFIRFCDRLPYMAETKGWGSVNTALNLAMLATPLAYDKAGVVQPMVALYLRRQAGDEPSASEWSAIELSPAWAAAWGKACVATPNAMQKHWLSCAQTFWGAVAKYSEE